MEAKGCGSFSTIKEVSTVRTQTVRFPPNSDSVKETTQKLDC